MFTGFASENTPAIQVWDFFRPYTGTARVSLADDCAPIQVFRTGAATTVIRVYLPTAPIEGKQITIVNQRYGANAQKVEIYSSDTSGEGASFFLFTLGAADSLILVYSKQNITYGPNTGVYQTGWISLNKSSPTASNFYSAIVGGDNHAASGAYSFIGGGNNNAVNASSTAIVGGINNKTSNTSAAVVGGSNNEASGGNAAVVGGTSNTASGLRAIVSGQNNIASGENAAVFGDSNNASGIGAGIFGSSSSSANSTVGVVIGGAYATTRSIIGNFVIPASVIPVAVAVGASQSATLLLGRQTTDATATRLASNNQGVGTTNQVILPNNSAYYVKGSVIATVTGGGNTKSWDFIATIKRGANAAATSIVGAVTLNVQAADAGAATWLVAITADTTNGGLAVTVTGQAATTIRWVCKLESTEVTY